MVVFGVVFLFCWTLTTHGKYSVSGDEPHYLMIAESLRTDRDLDLANNYSQNDGRLFGHENLPVELHAARALNGQLRSVHGIGLAVFVLPVYTAAQYLANLVPADRLERFRMGRGLFAYSIISLFLMAMTAFGIALLAAGLSNISQPRDAAIVAIAIGVSPPVASHSFLIFPEVVAMFVTCWTVWFVCKGRAPTDLRNLLWLALALGVLPWFHQKYIAYSIGLLFVLWWRRWDLTQRAPAHSKGLLVLMFAAPQILAVMWLLREWGSPGGALTSGVLGTGSVPMTAGSFAQGAFGLLVDRQSGLLAYAPLYWLAPACVILTWRQTRDVLVPALMLYLPAAGFVIGWWAGFSPAARYLAPAAPLFAIPAVLALSHKPVRRVALVFLVWQGLFNAVLWQHPRWLWPGASENRLLEAFSWPGSLYSSVLVPIRQSGLTPMALLPVVVAIGFSLLIVAATARSQRRVR